MEDPNDLEDGMTTYSVTDAKAGFSRLIDRALDGEDVVITRYGKPVVELRAIATPQAGQITYKWLRARRLARKGVGLTSVELLRQVYEEA